MREDLSIFEFTLTDDERLMQLRDAPVAETRDLDSSAHQLQ